MADDQKSLSVLGYLLEGIVKGLDNVLVLRKGLYKLERTLLVCC